LITGAPLIAGDQLVQPVAVANTGRDTIISAVDRSLSEESGSLIRNTTFGYMGVEASSVDHLEWAGQAGRQYSRMQIDEKYLDSPDVRDLIDSMNNKRALDDSELDADQLGAAFDEIRQSVVAMVDSVEFEGRGMEPIGLGWWQGKTEGIGDTQKLDLLIVDGRMVTIVLTADAIGSTSIDRWEFFG